MQYFNNKPIRLIELFAGIGAQAKAQETGEVVNLCCAIGVTEIDGKPYSEIVKIARKYIASVGGFEKFAERGLV